MQEDDAVSETTQNSEPTKCHAIGGTQTSCIQPGLTAMPWFFLPAAMSIFKWVSAVHKNKGKDHNNQTQQYFIKFLKYINNNMPNT